MTASEHEREVLDIVDRFFAALNAGDLEACRAIFADDALYWRNATMAEVPKDEILAPLAPFAGKVKYDVTRRYVVPDGCIVQFVVRWASPDRPAAVPHIQRIVCENGRIARIEVYFDSAQAKAFAG